MQKSITALLWGGTSRRGVTVPALVGGCLLALAVAAPLAALRGAAGQAGGIEGVVRDAGGAVVEGARVKAALAGGDQVEFAKTDASGQFVLRPLPEGVWAVSVAKPGFALSRVEGIAERPAGGGPHRDRAEFHAAAVAPPAFHQTILPSTTGRQAPVAAGRFEGRLCQLS